jgi:hypothetical protein
MTMASQQSTLSDLVARYREGAAGTSHPDPEIANSWQKKMHACYKELRQTQDGRSAIRDLVSHPDSHVRIWAASHSLSWAPDIARPALEALRKAGGILGFEAEIILEQFDKRKLSFD